jgi:hypothetical protein
LTINATGTKSTGLAISANAAKSIILGGDASLALGAASIMAGNAATASIVGAGGFSGGLAGLKATAAIDASASTGTNSVTIGASQTYKGGAGADTVTLTAVPGVAVDGGAGSNTLALKNIGDLSTLTSTALAAATNFQTLQLTGNIGTAPGGTVAEGTLDLSGLTTGMVNVVLNGAALEALTLSNGAANTAITILAAPTQAVTYTQKTDTSSDSLVLTMGNGTNAAISTAAGGVVFTADKIENVTIHSNADTSVAAVTNMLNAHLAAATTLTIDGAAGLDLTHSTLTKVTTIDGHASTGNLILAASGVTSGVTITTGSGNDTIFGSAIAKTATNAATVDTIRAGDGNNAITELHGNNVITAGTGSDQIMAGDGNNTITTTTIKAGLHSAIGIAGGNNTIMSGDVAGSGNMVVTEAVAVGVVGGNNTITLGHGTADSVTLMDGNNTVTVGNGGDMVWVGNGNNTIVSGNGIDLIKVGTGMNVVTTGGGRNATSGAADVIEFTDANQAVNTYTTINDFTTKGEKLQFETVVLALTAGADITSNVNAGAAAFQDYADYAFKNSAQNTVDWFAYKGDTYVVVHESAGTSFVSGMDIIVKLVGAVDLSAATIGAGTIIHG